MYGILSLGLLSLAFTGSTVQANPVIARASEIHALSQNLGIQSPNFTDVDAMWSTSFQRKDAAGDLWDVQLPRVLANNQYDAAESARLFLERHSGADEAWKVNAQPITTSAVAERQLAAYLKLKYCGKDNVCTQFELSYNANACQYAPCK
jgi:hypothetical protein